MGRFSRNKGKRGELEARDVIKLLLGTDTKRGQQRSGREEQDVINHVPLSHCEVKRTETLSIYKAMEQAETDCKPNEVPWILHRRNGKPWLLILKWTDLLRFVRRLLLVKRVSKLKGE